jgi:hypothetical protein
MIEYIMKKEIFGTFHAKCGARDLTRAFGTVPRKAGRVVTLITNITLRHVLMYYCSTDGSGISLTMIFYINYIIFLSIYVTYSGHVFAFSVSYLHSFCVWCKEYLKVCFLATGQISRLIHCCMQFNRNTFFLFQLKGS